MKNNFSAIIIALAVIVTAFILANAYKNRHAGANTIAVTGLGSRDFESDLIVWSGSFSQKSMTLKNAYDALDADREKIKQYLAAKGIADSQIVYSAVNIEKMYDYSYDTYGNRQTSVFTGYALKQTVQIESGEVDKIEELSRQVTELINQGIEFTSNAPEYYYTKLAALKIEMIAEATQDAHARAKKIAENADAKVGRLKNASMGVFQIVAQNSNEDYSWGGAFNTSSKRKTASITVKLDYATR